ncbi:MAG: plasma membrane calcium, partial [Watsoniomyces obsoletus]
MDSLSVTRANTSIVQLLPFDSKNKYMGAVVQLPSGQYRLLMKGASEVLLKLCTEIADIENNTSTELASATRESLEARITFCASNSLRTIAICYQDFPQWPPAGTASSTNPQEAEFSLVLKSSCLQFLGVVGIQDPVRPGVPKAVQKAQHAGVVVRMVTGDNAITAQAIAT